MSQRQRAACQRVFGWCERVSWRRFRLSLLGKLIELDRQLFLFLNGLHTPWLDQPMYYISTDWFWIPLYSFLIFLIIRKCRRQAWLPILAIVLSIVLSDQLSGKIKKTVRRSRPTHDTELADKVHTVNNYKGGTFGFVSSHAANTFCVAFFISTFLQFSFAYTALLFFWAFVVSYSRVYLGVHFPLDLFCGAILGVVIAKFIFLLEKRCQMRFFSKTVLP